MSFHFSMKTWTVIVLRSTYKVYVRVTVRGQGKVGIITQTDLSLIRISEQLSAYLTELGLTGADEELTNDKQNKIV
ncbi:unnamed protein product [Toxocara canis]|uniref:40S ribosomal protein S28 n=1 Tax=Toxocara canis TaxID=6265 RepID=A0A183UD81_TOXCA|nr:unnamed protein product [Toxocara canis]